MSGSGSVPRVRRSLIIVGSGIAGLTAALRAVDEFEVTLVTKSDLTASNTLYAQGGIAAALFDDDSVASHALDTLRAGAGLGDYEAVEVLCAEGPERVRELIARGVAFDLHGGRLARGLEAAHSHARVLHAGGDATGSAIESTLAQAVRAAGIEIVEQAFLAELIVEEGRAVGVELINPDGVISRRYAHAVVLATGGAGTLFAHTTNPSIATGDGVAAAWRAGVRLTDVEFYQFHPTALAAAGGLLVSEAVRGEGAVLLDARGERFMLDAHPDAELAPRDVVARAIATRMAAQGGKPVLLDATALGAAHLAERFPTIDSGTRAAGLDWGAMPIPVTPAAHYWMGGIATDVWGRSSLPGLFAVGEVACTGVHGANRLASNSLLEGLVFADRAIRALTEDSAALSVPTLSVPTLSVPTLSVPTLSVPTLSSAALSEPTLSQADSGSIAAGPAGPADPSWDRAALQSLMWDSAGVQRCGDELRATAATLASWSVPERSPGSPASASLALREDENLLQLARLVVTAALAREESRGAHFRTDFPGTAAESQHLVLQREESLAC